MPPVKTQISLRSPSAWSESSPGTLWIAKDQMLLHADSEDSDQSGQMPWLIVVFAGGSKGHFVGFVKLRLS